MGRPQVGVSSLQGDIAKYAERFDMVELRLDSMSTPKTATLRAWRRAVNPAFTFSVVLPKTVGALNGGAEADKAVKTALEIARVLEARCIVVETPIDVRPTKANRDKLKTLFGKLKRASVELCWEPRGIWELADIRTTAKALGVLPVLDATKDRLPAGSSVYTRVRSLGQRGVSPKAIAELAEQLQGRREAWVVVDDRRSASRVRTELVGALSALTHEPPPMVVKPSPGRLRAEDEEQ
jgi:uncharacterized protein YecE (DUF72 family)